MIVGREELIEITRTVFETTLGLDPGPESRASGTLPNEVVCSISITGAWDGTVSIALTEDLARKITASMLACSAEDATPSDVDDAIGEVVNMLGGSVKALLPGPSQLSLPSAQKGAGESAESTITFACGGQTFAVVIRPNKPEQRDEP